MSDERQGGASGAAVVPQTKDVAAEVSRRDGRRDVRTGALHKLES